MGFRPQFAYQTPAGFVDERAEFPFDFRNCTSVDDQLNFQIAPNQFLYNQVLRLDDDAPFLWRAIYWDYPITTCQAANWLMGNICFRIRDAYGNYLSNDFIPLLNYAQGLYTFQPWQSLVPNPGPLLAAPITGGMGVPFADEFVCPASSVLQFDILSTLCNTDGGIGRFMAQGVKRRPIADCPTEYR